MTKENNMPKETFHSLKDEKKQRVVDAALEEFSVKTFSQASLNKIIKNAGIPKGSFYQYFENKEELYTYLLETTSKASKEMFAKVQEMNPTADTFEIILRTTEQSFRQTNIDSRYTRIALLTILDDSDFIVDIRKKGASQRRTIDMLERDKECGKIKPDVDSELVANMISAFSLRELFRCGSDIEKYLKNIGEAINIIREGVSL